MSRRANRFVSPFAAGLLLVLAVNYDRYLARRERDIIVKNYTVTVAAVPQFSRIFFVRTYISEENRPENGSVVSRGRIIG